MTPRRQQVLELVIAGRSYKEIGRELGISERTAEAHAQWLCEFYGVRRKSELAARVMRPPVPVVALDAFLAGQRMGM